MRIYVAGKFEETEVVRGIQRQLRDAGHIITHDWTGENPGGLRGTELADFLKECARKDMEGVADADAVVLLNHDRAFGAMTEFGIALALGIPVLILKSEIRDNIFYNLGEDYGVIKVQDMDDVIDTLVCFELGKVLVESRVNAL